MHKLRLFRVNGQTAMVIDNVTNIIYAVANQHLLWMVYNKPMCTDYELERCRELFKENHFLIEKEIPTDSFSIGFWNEILQETTLFGLDIKYRMEAEEM